MRRLLGIFVVTLLLVATTVPVHGVASQEKVCEGSISGCSGTPSAKSLRASGKNCPVTCDCCSMCGAAYCSYGAGAGNVV